MTILMIVGVIATAIGALGLAAVSKSEVAKVLYVIAWLAYCGVAICITTAHNYIEFGVAEMQMMGAERGFECVRERESWYSRKKITCTQLEKE